MSTPKPTVQHMQRLIEQIRGGAPLAASIDRDTRFVQDLGMASLELITLVYLCEQTFAVSLATLTGLIETLHTVGQSVDAIARLQEDCMPPAPQAATADLGLAG